MPIIIFYLGSQGYGDYLTLLAYIGFYALIDFNFGLFLTKELSKNANTEDKNQLVSIGLIATIFSILIILCLGLFFNYIFPKIVKFDFYSKYNFYFILMLWNKVIHVFVGYFSSLLNSLHKMFFLNILKSVLTLLEVLIAVILFTNDFGIKSLFYSEFSISLLLLFITIIYTNKFFEFRIIKINLKLIKNAVNYSFSHYLVKISNLGLSNLDSIIIHYFLGSQFVSLYSISLKLPILFSREIAGKFSVNLFSSISSLSLTNLSSYHRKLLSRIVYSVFRFAILITISVYFINKSFVSIWVGEDLFFGNNLNLVFCLMLFIEIIYFSIETFVLANSQIKNLGRLSLLELLANLFLSLFLIKYFGLVGVAFASLISKTLIPLSYVLLKTKETYKIEYPNKTFYLQAFYSFLFIFIFFQIFENLNNYLIILFGSLFPFLINILIVDYKVLKNKKIKLTDKIHQIIYGKI